MKLKFWKKNKQKREIAEIKATMKQNYEYFIERISSLEKQVKFLNKELGITNTNIVIENESQNENSNDKITSVDVTSELNEPIELQPNDNDVNTIPGSPVENENNNNSNPL